MSSFSIDDVRDTFGADIQAILGRVETLGRSLLVAAPSGDPAPGGPAGASFEPVGDCFHTIYGTTMLVGAKSLAGTASRLEQLTITGQEALQLAIEQHKK